MVHILEHCRITPPPNTAESTTLPLTYFDMFWLELHPIQRLLFYKNPLTKSHFTNKIIPNIKTSLSLSLKHFLPLTGHFIYPLNRTNSPLIRYKVGDSVSLTFAESNENFSFLVGSEIKEADKFYEFVPQLGPTLVEGELRKIPILSVQVTFFPGFGLVIGLTNHHIVGDASSTVRFIKAWSSICRFGNDCFVLENGFLPLFDRCLIKDLNGNLAKKYWNELRNVELRDSDIRVLSGGKFRATFVLKEAEIGKLKGRVSEGYVSSFTVACGYVWSCLAKAGEEVGEEDGVMTFIVAADFRARLDPPLPANYFGNCIGPCFAESVRGVLVGVDGFVAAAKLIGEAIYDRFLRCGEGGVLRGVDDWPAKINTVDWSRALGTAGSPRFDVYDADFGWGRPVKFESVSIDADGSMSIFKARDEEKGLEIGLSLPKAKMDAYARIFNDGLSSL